PMRSIPFKVVCLLGMNDTAYPRRDRAPEFDLIAQHRRPGDRNSRADDRALFLEALLSARDVFYVSYVGQSMRDNSPLPPSVVVSELNDYIEHRFAIDAEQFVVKHPLQAFSPRNFGADDKRCFSYSLDNSAAGQIAAENRHEPPPFFDKPLNEPEDLWRDVDLGRLVEFFAHPAKFFLRKRLNIELPRDREEIEDREPFALHPLDRYAIGQRLLAEALDGRDLEDALAIVRASGTLPPGATGALLFEELCTSARMFANAVRHHVSAEKEPAVTVRARIGQFNLSGRLGDIRGEALVHFRLAKFGKGMNGKGEVSVRIPSSGSPSAASATLSTKNGRKSAAAFLRRFFLSANEHETGIRRRIHASGKRIHRRRSQRWHREDNH